MANMALNPILVDTLFVVALVNRRGQHHAVATELSRQYEGRRLLITEAILFEIGNALARGWREEAVEILSEFASSEDVEIIRGSLDLFAEALALYDQHADKSWGLTDCLSFVVMRRRGMTEALTHDRHFAQAGFVPLMRGS